MHTWNPWKMIRHNCGISIYSLFGTHVYRFPFRRFPVQDVTPTLQEDSATARLTSGWLKVETPRGTKDHFISAARMGRARRFVMNVNHLKAELAATQPTQHPVSTKE